MKPSVAAEGASLGMIWREEDDMARVTEDAQTRPEQDRNLYLDLVQKFPLRPLSVGRGIGASHQCHRFIDRSRKPRTTASETISPSSRISSRNTKLMSIQCRRSAML